MAAMMALVSSAGTAVDSRHVGMPQGGRNLRQVADHPAMWSNGCRCRGQMPDLLIQLCKQLRQFDGSGQLLDWA